MYISINYNLISIILRLNYNNNNNNKRLNELKTLARRKISHAFKHHIRLATDSWTPSFQRATSQSSTRTTSSIGSSHRRGSRHNEVDLCGSELKISQLIPISPSTTTQTRSSRPTPSTRKTIVVSFEPPILIKAMLVIKTILKKHI